MQWHAVAPYQDSQEFPPKLQHHTLHGYAHAHAHVYGLPAAYTPGMTLEDIKRCEDEHRASGVTDDDLLCLRIVKHSRMMLKTLESGVPRVGG